MNSKFSVAICGGGISGLALGAYISHYMRDDGKILVDIYESRPNISSRGEGISIWKRTWQLLQSLGLEEEMAKRNLPRPTDGEVRGPIFRKSDQPEPGYDFHNQMMPYGPISIPRPMLLDMLRSMLNKNCTIHTSKTLQSYEEDENHKITIRFADGSSATTDVLIGADGVHSAARANLLEILAAKAEPAQAAKLRKSIEPVWSGTCLYRCLMPMAKMRAALPGHQALISPKVWCGKNKHILTHPQGEIMVIIMYYSRPEAEGTTFDGNWIEDVPPSEVIEAFKGWEPDLCSVLQVLERPSRWAVHVVDPLERSVAGHAALMGDAAHAMTPHQGIGGSQGIEDAHILGRLLTHQDTTVDNVAHALSVYEKLRLPAAHIASERSRFNGYMYEFNHPDYPVTSEASKEDLKGLGKAIGDSFEWLSHGGCEEDWEAAERLFQNGGN